MKHLSACANTDNISELMESISSLKYEIILLESDLKKLKELYLRNFNDLTRQEITDTEVNLNALNQQSAELFLRLRQLQTHYLVQFDAEFQNARGNTCHETQTESVYLTTNCIIDTTKDTGWQQYSNDAGVKKLLSELSNFLILHRYSNFKILHIQKK